MLDYVAALSTQYLSTFVKMLRYSGGVGYSHSTPGEFLLNLLLLSGTLYISQSDPYDIVTETFYTVSYKVFCYTEDVIAIEHLHVAS